MITALPVMGLGLRQSFTALVSLPQGIGQSIRLLRRHRADLVVGIGGYTSPPVLLAAALMRIPRVILEPNAYPGKANLMLGPLAQRVFVAFESAASHFQASKVRVFGVPIRRAFLESPTPTIRHTGARTLLVFGGSRGARAINVAMIDALSAMVRDSAAGRVSVIHQTGEEDYARVKAAYQGSGIDVEVVPFLYDMPTAFRAADLVVSRAGAMTLAELTACGKPAVLIPFPHAIYDHQARNAEVLESAGAAVVIPQRELNGPKLTSVVGGLLREPGRLQSMAERSRSLGKTNAAEAIVRECLTVIRREAGV